MYEVVEWAVAELPDARPRHLLGIGEIDDLLRGVELGIDTFDCAMPTRLGRHGMAIVPDPGARWRVDLAKGRFREADEPILEGCPCPACARGYSRAYLHYLVKARESTASRLLTIHNLAYMERLMAELRAAIEVGRLGRRSRRRAGARRRGSSGELRLGREGVRGAPAGKWDALTPYSGVKASHFTKRASFGPDTGVQLSHVPRWTVHLSLPTQLPLTFAGGGRPTGCCPRSGP